MYLPPDVTLVSTLMFSGVSFTTTATQLTMSEAKLGSLIPITLIIKVEVGKVTVFSIAFRLSFSTEAKPPPFFCCCNCLDNASMLGNGGGGSSELNFRTPIMRREPIIRDGFPVRNAVIIVDDNTVNKGNNNLMIAKCCFCGNTEECVDQRMAVFGNVT